MDSPVISKRYEEYRLSASKIGLIEAQTQYIRINQDIGPDRWLLDLLLEFHLIQETVLQYAHDINQANQQIRANIRLLANNEYIQTRGKDIVQALDWFEELERDVRPYALQHVLEGCVHLPTRCDVVRCLVQFDPLNIQTNLDRLLFASTRLRSQYQIYLGDMVLALVEQEPNYAALARLKLTEMQLLPEVVTIITVKYCQDEIDYLNGVFQGFPAWYAVQLTPQGAAYIAEVKQRIFEQIEKFMTENPLKQAQLGSSLRVLAGLIGYLGIKLNEHHVSICMSLLQQTNSERLVKLLLCIVVLSADQFLRLYRGTAQVLTELLQSTVSEMPMLLMVYSQTNQFDRIESLICSVLDMQMMIPKLGLFEMQKVFNTIQPGKS
ncbi:hypothetical protein VTP01DRAFT_7930 [Rhizomucor pusillus]|uniref:uncharacterized protein n=1 Tax=Rhizomucor pusillus TaxID=4840 RepID=UPI0037448BAE